MSARSLYMLVILAGLVALAVGQTTQPAPPASAVPTTQATTFPSRLSAEEMLTQMLRPTSQGARPLQPIPDGGASTYDRSSTYGAVAPNATKLNLIPEGTIIPERVGHLSQTPDGQLWQFAFEADGRGMLDPPLLVLPNKMLHNMQMRLTGGNADIRFRMTGEVTQYDGRNWILIQKASQVPDMVLPLK